MSWKLMEKVLELPTGILSSSQKLVLIDLCKYARDDGTNVYPSLKRIGRDTEYSIRQMKYILRSLESKGFIILMNDGRGGRGKTRHYQIDTSKLDPQKGATIAPLINENDPQKGANYDTKGGKLRHKRGQITTLKGATIAPESVRESVNEYVREEEKKKNGGKPPYPPPAHYFKYFLLSEEEIKSIRDEALELGFNPSPETIDEILGNLDYAFETEELTPPKNRYRCYKNILALVLAELKHRARRQEEEDLEPLGG